MLGAPHDPLEYTIGQDGIAIEVIYDGPGGARLEKGTALTGLADRVASGGGSFAISRPQGRARGSPPSCRVQANQGAGGGQRG